MFKLFRDFDKLDHKGYSTIVIFFGDPKGNRTPIARMKTWCPDR